MEKFDWKVPLKLNITSLKIMGLWPPGDKSYKLNFYTFYSVIIIIFFVVGYNILQLYSTITSLHDLAAATLFTCAVLPVCLANMKTYCLIRNMKLLKSLMMDTNSDVFQPKNSRQMNLYKTGLRSWQMMYKMYHAVIIGTYITWTIYLMVENVKTNEKQLYVPVKTPYDYTPSPVFEFTYFYLVLSDMFMCIINVETDTLIAALNTFIAIQCDILCDDLRHMKNSQDIEKNLLECIQHHKAILTFAEKSNKFLNWLVLAQFATSVFSIACILLQATSVSLLSSESIAYSGYVSAITTQIFIFCWFGNKTELQSSKIPDAILESDWIGSPLRVQKNILIFVCRTQKPIKMSAFKFFYLTLDTFLNIMRMAYSYFTVLKEVNA